MVTAALRALLAKWGRALGRIIARWLSTRGTPVTPAQRQEMARRLYPEVQRYRQRSYEAAVVQMRDQMPHIPPAPIRPYEPAALVSVIERATDAEPPRRARARVTVAPAELDPTSRRQSRVRVAVTPESRYDPAVIQAVIERIDATVERHVRQAGRDAVIDTADGAGEEIGWARVLSGTENCGFCAMLASRGPVYRSDKSALTVVGDSRGRRRGSRDVGEAFHDNCDCETVLVRRGEDWEGRAEFERLEHLWIAVSADPDEPDARLAFNRAYARAQKNPEMFEQLEQLWETSTEGLSESNARAAFADAVRENYKTNPPPWRRLDRPRRAQ